MRRTIIVAGLTLALAACGSQTHQTAAAPTTIATTTTQPTMTPESALLAAVKAAGFGSADLDDPSNNPTLVSLARDNVCGLFDAGADYGTVANAMLGATTNKNVSGPQVKTFIRAAVENFCPQYEGQLPS